MSRSQLRRRRLTQTVRGSELLEERRLLAVAPLVGDFPGISQTYEDFFFNPEIFPSDASAAVGPGANGVVVAAVNGGIAIYSKATGLALDEAALAGSFSQTTFFREVEQFGDLGFRPQVHFDTYSNRFFVMALQNDGVNSSILLAVSTTPTPNDLDTRFGDADNDWHTYSIATQTGFGALNGGFDWARFATDHDSLYLVGNYINNTTGNFVRSNILRFAKDRLVTGPGGALQPTTHFTVIPVGSNGFSLTPVETSGRGVSDPQLFVEARIDLTTGAGLGLRVWQLDDNNVLTSRFHAAPFSDPADVPQPQSGAQLTIAGGRLNNAVLRAGSIWTAHTVADPDDGEANVRWYEIESSGLFQIIQTGDVDPGPRAHAFVPAINANFRGDMALTYTQVSNSTTAPAQFPSMMYTTRLAADAPGITEPGAVIRAGRGAYELQAWGYQAALALDPSDNETFYAFHEAAVDTRTWETWFGVFRYANPVVSGFGRVVAQTPSDVANSPPLWLGIEFNQAMLTTSFEISDVLSFTGPGGVNLPVADYVLGFEWVNDFALRIFLRPLTIDGTYTMVIGPTLFTAATGSPLDQDGDGIGGEPGDDNYVATFELDLAEIVGIKYHDRNGNGRRDPGEEPLKDWRIYLDTNENGVFDRETRVAIVQPGLPIPQPSPDPVSLITTLEIQDLASEILDVNVALNITHTFDRDLTVQIVSPSGVRVTLFTDIGLDGDNFLGTVLDDEASVSIADGSAPFTGTFRPLEPLSQFDGLDPNGTWTLIVTDNSPGDTGVLIDWAVQIEASEPSRLTDAAGRYSFSGLSGGSYRVAEVPQPGWVQTEPALPGLKITEIDMGFPDFIEIQNVTGSAINTAGWFVAVSGEPFGAENLNVVNPVTWRLPATIDAGEILFRSDSPSNNYFGGNIFWNDSNTRFGSGWAMIVDDAGRIVDWVGWGFTAADLQGFNVQITSGGHAYQISAAQLQAAWQGNALFISPGVDPATIKRVGSSDSNRASDFEFSPFASVGGTNASLIVPMADTGGQARTVLLQPGEEITAVNFGNLFVGPGDPPPASVEALGPVTWTTRSAVTLSDSAHWYRFSAQRDGQLTLLGAPGAGADVALELYTTTMQSVATARSGPGADGRIDLNVRAGDEFFLAVRGSGKADLTWANVVSLQGNRLDLAAGPGDDLVSVQFAAASLALQVNGLHYSFPLSGLSTIRLQGGGGSNRLALGDTAGDDTLEAKLSRITFTTAGLTLQADGFRELAATATRGGFDRAFLYDSSGDDTLTTQGAYAELASAAHRFTVAGYDRLRAYASSGFDRAFLNDTPGDETVTLKPDVVQQLGGAFDNYAHGFDRVRTYGGRGFDRAFMYDSAGDDTLTAQPTTVQLTGANYDNYAQGFHRVRAFASGGFDRAFLYDSPGSDDLYLYADRTEFKGANYDNIVYGFDRLRAFAGQGFDRAFLYDSPANDDVFLYPYRTELKGANYDNIVYDFERVRAFASAGFDRAYFYDTAGDDTLNVRGTSTQLSGAGYDNFADHFDVVRVFASSGFDRLTVHDTAGDDNLLASPTEIRVRGAGYDVTARGFDAGTFLAGSGNDVAELMDSSGDDLIEAVAAHAYFTSSQFAWTLSGFKRVRACSVSGGVDRLRMSAIDYLLEEVGRWQHE